MALRPPNAKSFFIGDKIGGSGWEVEMGDGSKMKYYVDLPSDIGHIELYLQDAPNEHLGQKLKSKDIVYLGELYMRYLEGLVAKAKQFFAKSLK